MYILGIPILLVLMIAAVILLLLCNKWKTALVILILAIGINRNTQTYPIHPSYRWNWKKISSDSCTFNVMTYNIALKSDSALIDYLDTLDLDLLCLQECNLLPNNNSLQNRFRYHEGNRVFCQYPIHHFKQYKIEEDSPLWEELADSMYNKDNILQKDMTIYSMIIDFPRGPVHVLNCHLQSNGYSTARRKMEGAPWIDGVDEYYARIKFGYKARKIQADLIQEEIKQFNNEPILIVGDFNDLSGSYALKNIQEKKLNDAWWEGGLGAGFTFDALHLLLRLDHILYSSDFQLEEVYVDSDAPYSDHYPLRACLKYK